MKSAVLEAAPPIALLSVVDDSTGALERHPDQREGILSICDGIIRSSLEKSGGSVLREGPSGILAVFERPQGAKPLEAAIEIQRKVQEQDWAAASAGLVRVLKVRMAFHTLRPEDMKGDGEGPGQVGMFRLLSAGWGGQILLSVQAAATCSLPKGAGLKDLGVHRLRETPEPQRIYGLVHPDLRFSQCPALRSEGGAGSGSAGRVRGLPASTTPFIGREEELRRLEEWLTDPSIRMVTILGPGGMGKTRLASRVAEEMLPTFSDGVCFVDLVKVAEPGHIAAALAASLRLPRLDLGDPKAQVVQHIRNQKILLILDNFEHLVAGSGIVAEILASTEGVKILATSGTRLNLKGEHIFEIPGLGLGEAAPEFFASRARSILPDFELVESDRPAVLRICKLVQGMPLGLEIAASWLRVLSCREIADEIERNPEALESSMQDLPERHRSVKALFQHFWDLLNAQEKDALSRLSVYRGGFLREALKPADVPLTALISLVDKSLLRRGVDGRLEIPELFRPWAEERLKRDPAALAAAQAAHGTYYLELLKAGEAGLKGKGQLKVVRSIKAELENVKAAWNRAVAGGDEAGLNAASNGLFVFLNISSMFAEGASLFGLAAESFLDKESRVWARLSARQGLFLKRNGKEQAGLILLHRALDVARRHKDREEEAFCLRYLGNTTDAEQARARPGAEDLLQEAHDIYERLGDRWGQALCRSYRGHFRLYLGDQVQAKRLFEESIAIFRELGDLWELGWGLYGLAELSEALGAPQATKSLLEDMIRIHRGFGPSRGTVWAHLRLSSLHQGLGDLGRARECAAEGIALSKESGDLGELAWSQLRLAQVALAAGDHAQVKTCAAGSLSHFEKAGYSEEYLDKARDLLKIAGAA